MGSMVPDYYVMLGIDPSADRSAIEAALDRSRHQWSSGTRNPKYKHTYQSYLDQVPAIRRDLLGDPSVRAAYDAELTATFKTAHASKLDELQRLVRLRAAKGGLTVSDRTLLRDRASKLGLSGEDLARLIEPIPPKPEAPVSNEPIEATDEILDPVTRRQIRSALELVTKRDLYDALGLNRDAPMSEISLRADSERQRWMRKSQLTAEKTAWLEVISYAQSHLTHPEGRVRYESTLFRDAVDEFSKVIQFALEGLPSLDPGTRHALLDEASIRGITPDRAERLITVACRSHGVSRDSGFSSGIPFGEGPPRFLRCRTCGGVTDHSSLAKKPDQATCKHCRVSLRWDCPVCRKGHWVDETRCPCGFEVRNLEPLIRHFEAAQHANKIKDYDGALDHLTRVQEFAPHHIGSRKAIEKLKERVAEIGAKKAEFELARIRKQLIAAREALLGWAQLVDPSSPSLLTAQAELFAALREALSRITQAREIESTNPNAARSHYRHALGLAADLPEAIEGLRRLPPDPPQALHASLEGDQVKLRWTSPAADGLGSWSFQVVRKLGGVPAQIEDGSLVAETSGFEAIDPNAPAGQAVGYAVFTVRNGIASTSSTSLAPFTILLEVSDLRAEGSRGEICLSWILPNEAKGARVVRLGGSGSTDKLIDSLADHAVDRGLEETRIYRYRVSAVYKVVDGKSNVSPGTEIAATPAPPALPAGPISLFPDADGRVTLRWPAVVQGKVKVLRTLSPLSLPHGSRIGSADLSKLDGVWLDSTSSEGTTDPDPPSVGVCHYTPIVFLNGTGTVGTPVGYSSVPDPTDLRVVRVGTAGRVHLRWRWTPRANETIVVAKPGSPPVRPDDSDSLVTNVSEVEYSRQGYFTLNLPSEASTGPWHLAVFSLANVDGVKLTSPGLEPTARTVVPGPNPEITVTYVFRRPTFPGRPWGLTLQTDPPGSAIPPMALVTHPRSVPLSVDDGQIIDRFPSCRDGSTFAIKPLIDLTRQRARLFADPNNDPAGQPPIRLKHPDSAGTRV